MVNMYNTYTRRRWQKTHWKWTWQQLQQSNVNYSMSGPVLLLVLGRNHNCNYNGTPWIHNQIQISIAYQWWQLKSQGWWWSRLSRAGKSTRLQHTPVHVAVCTLMFCHHNFLFNTTALRLNISAFWFKYSRKCMKHLNNGGWQRKRFCYLLFRPSRLIFRLFA